jgi:chromosome segregation ATPase
MNALHLLEEKVCLLVEHIKKLQGERDVLVEEQKVNKKEYSLLSDELENVLQENKKLQTKLKELQKTSADGNKELELLSHEREQALLAVDNLIKSIDGLITHEAVQ